MVVGMLVYHNYKLNKMGNGHLWDKLLSIFSPGSNSDAVTIRYTNDGRSGHVWYRSRETEFAMYYEFSGGDCVASIDIPSPENWEKATRLPLERRIEVLEFIGRQVAKDQVSSGTGYFKIEGNWLNIYA